MFLTLANARARISENSQHLTGCCSQICNGEGSKKPEKVRLELHAHFFFSVLHIWQTVNTWVTCWGKPLLPWNYSHFCLPLYTFRKHLPGAKPPFWSPAATQQHSIFFRCLRGPPFLDEVHHATMKVTVTFGQTGVVVPCKEGWTVRELIQQATQRYRKLLEQVSSIQVLLYSQLPRVICGKDLSHPTCVFWCLNLVLRRSDISTCPCATLM